MAFFLYVWKNCSVFWLWKKRQKSVTCHSNGEKWSIYPWRIEPMWKDLWVFVHFRQARAENKWSFLGGFANRPFQTTLKIGINARFFWLFRVGVIKKGSSSLPSSWKKRPRFLFRRDRWVKNSPLFSVRVFLQPTIQNVSTRCFLVFKRFSLPIVFFLVEHMQK